MAYQIVAVNDASPGDCSNVGLTYNGTDTLISTKAISGTALTLSSALSGGANSDLSLNNKFVVLANTGDTSISGNLELFQGHITFPATQNKSAEETVLDDYREGYFTPTLSFGAASAGIIYNTQFGSFVKIGAVVNFTVRISLSSKGTSVGLVEIDGLPYAATNHTDMYFSPNVMAERVPSISINPHIYISPNATHIRIGAIHADSSLDRWTEQNLNDNSQLTISGMYFSH